MQYESINPTKLARLFNGSASAVFVARELDWAIVDVNDIAEVRLGCSREQMLGRSGKDLGRELGAGLLLEKLPFGGQGFVIGFVPSALAQGRESSYVSFFEDSDQGLFRFDVTTKRIIEANTKLATMLGYESVSPLLASGESPINAPNYYARDEDAKSLLQNIADTRMSTRRVKLRRVDGSEFWASESARGVHDVGGSLRFIEGHISELSASAVASPIEAHHRLIFDHAATAIFGTIHHRIIFANPALCELLQYSGAELDGKNFMELVVAADLDYMRGRLRRRALGEFVEHDYEVSIIRKDGAVRRVAVRADPIMIDGEVAITGSMRDVTEARAAAERLDAAEARYRNLFENAALGLFVVQSDGNLSEANRAVNSMFGYDPLMPMQNFVENFAQLFADSQDRQRFVDAIQKNAMINYLEMRMLHRAGHEFWAGITVRPADEMSHPSTRDSTGVQNNKFECSIQDVSARRLAELQLKFQANHDSLTRMPNRQRFEQVVAELMSSSRKQNLGERAHWTLLLDLDGFKVVNDSLGHAAGDELLVMISDRLVKELSQELIFSRYGGDEFALVTRQPVLEGKAISIAEEVLNSLTRPFLVRGHQVFATASIGIARIEPSYVDPQHVMRDADTAMYHAKATGKNRYEMFDAEMLRAAQSRLSIETDLRFGIEREEFVTYFQPIVSLVTGRIVGAEALTRWMHPTRGLLLPGAFIHIAEESGLLLSVDMAMIHYACRQLALWQKQFGDNAPRTVSVNVSDRLFSSPGFAGTLSDLIRSAAVEPETVQLEITETVFRDNIEATLTILRELKSVGVRLLVDDFGTGYSSLVSFTQAAFDGLKIDRGFITDIESNARNRALVKTICQFAKDLNLGVVAEGIETSRQAEIMAEMGCELGQGFRYAPALPPDAFALRLQATNGKDKG